MFKLFLLTIFSATLILGCDNTNTNGPATVLPNSSTTTTVPSPATVTPSAPLALSIYTVYDTTQAVENQNFVETGNTVCQASSTTPVVTCTIVVPEARLYFSSLNFVLSWTTASCKLLSFKPYYYQASTSNAYVPPGASAPVDCSSAPTAACFGGAAPQLVPTFPAKKALIYLPDETITGGAQSTSLKMPSGYSLNTASNRTVANDMAAGNFGTSFSSAQIGGYNGVLPGDGYVANTMVNYQLSCRDDWYDPEPTAGAAYTINLVVKDQNVDPSGTSTDDNFYTWSELP